MPRHPVTMRSKGRITLPVRLREALHLKAGDTIDFIEVDGGYRIEARAHRLADLRGIVKSDTRVKAADIDWIREARGTPAG